MSEPKEGWTFLVNANKCHYFKSGRSLCGRWGYLATDPLSERPTVPACAKCYEKWEREIEKGAKK